MKASLHHRRSQLAFYLWLSKPEIFAFGCPKFPRRRIDGLAPTSGLRNLDLTSWCNDGVLATLRVTTLDRYV